MIKITHIEKHDELDVAFKVKDFLTKNYKHYFELKVADGGGNNLKVIHPVGGDSK